MHSIVFHLSDLEINRSLTKPKLLGPILGYDVVDMDYQGVPNQDEMAVQYFQVLNDDLTRVSLRFKIYENSVIFTKLYTEKYV